MNDRPRTERLRIAEAIVEARANLEEAERQHQLEPTPDRQAAVERAHRELEALERRMVQVNT